MCLVNKNRKPITGDVLIVKPCTWTIQPDSDVRSYMGIIYDIVLDKWGHQNNVFVHWSSDVPPNYNPSHGYAGTNIHNQLHEFDIVRNGIGI